MHIYTKWQALMNTSLPLLRDGEVGDCFKPTDILRKESSVTY